MLKHGLKNQTVQEIPSGEPVMSDPEGSSECRPLISIVIPVYNTAKYVRKSIESAFAQTYSPIEVIAVDDGSTDNTLEVLESYGDRIQILRQENQGCAGARNAGNAIARGEFVAALDSDDVWLPDKLERQMALIKQCPTLDLVFGKGKAMDETGNDLGIPLPTVIPDSLQLRQATEDGYVLEGNWFAVLANVNFIPHCSVLIRLSALQAVGGYDPEHRYSQDYHLWCRIAARGCRFGFIDRLTFYYRCHTGQVTHDRSSHQEDRKAVLMKLLRDPSYRFHPDVKRGLRRSLAALPKKAGDRAFIEGDRRSARKGYLEAFRYWPRPAQIASWFATFLGPAAPRVMAMINYKSDVFDELFEKHDEKPPKVSS